MGADPRGAAVTHPEGLRVFPTHAAGLGALGGGQIRTPPRSGRGRTCTRAPRSGRRGDPHQLPSLLKRQSGSHVLLRPRPTRGTRTPPRPGRWDPDWRALASPGAAGLAPPAPERQAPPPQPQPLTHPELCAPAHGAGGGKGRAARQARLSGPPPRRSARPSRSWRPRKARARAAAASPGSPLLASGLRDCSRSGSLLSKMARGSGSRRSRSARLSARPAPGEGGAGPGGAGRGGAGPGAGPTRLPVASSASRAPEPGDPRPRLLTSRPSATLSASAPPARPGPPGRPRGWGAGRGRAARPPPRAPLLVPARCSLPRSHY